MVAYLRVYELPFLVECEDVTVPDMTDAVRVWSHRGEPVVFTVGDGFTFVVNFHLLPVVLITDVTGITRDEDGELAPVVRVALPPVFIDGCRSELNGEHLV
ncbi:hypothetical protein [Umezawaea sp.]|uniref:hypothetical protein n=1 Tax=Umezawaea sp. TaxID=1955258 RepID=UPI002ED2712C